MWRWRHRGLRGPALPLTAIPRILGCQPKTVLELGANNGSDSMRMLSAFPEATVHCFEPDPRPYSVLEQRLRGTRARCYPLAIAAANGPITFHQSSGDHPEFEVNIPGGWHASGSIRTPKVHLTEFPWCTFDNDITVEAVTLDTWASGAGVDTVDFIWADVQGAERDVIAGGHALLARTRLLYTEYCNRELYEGQATLAELLQMLPGWRVLHRYEWDVLLENTR